MLYIRCRILKRHVLSRRRGIVYEDIDHAKLPFNFADHAINCILIRHVCRHGYGTISGLGQFAGGRCRRLLVISVYRHRGTTLSQQVGNGLADAFTGTGHKSYFTCQFHYLLLQLLFDRTRSANKRQLP